MANEMSTFVHVVNGNKEVADRLNEILKPAENDHEANSVSILNALLGTNYSYSGTKEGWDKEVDWPTQEIYDEYIGPKWLYAEYEHDDDPANAHIVLRSAWHVPTEFLEKLAEELYKIKEDCYIKGTYEDESYDPIGAFLYAKGFDDIEDWDDEVDFDRMWDDDEYRDELWENVNQMMHDIESWYLEDKKENPENYE
jgi:hypothetical protein